MMNKDNLNIHGILIPKVNLELYSQIYALENWIRRIVYAALMHTKCPDWHELIPFKQLETFKQKLNSMAKRQFLQCDSFQNYVWVTTFFELRELIKMPTIEEKMSEFTNLNTPAVKIALDMIGEIRNAISHNAPVADYTLEFFNSTRKEHIDQAILFFVNNILGWNTKNIIHNNYSQEDLAVRIFLNRRDEAKVVENSEEYNIIETKHYIRLDYLPEEPSFEKFVDVKNVIKELKSIEAYYLAILLDSEYPQTISLCFPKSIKDASILSQIIDTFLSYTKGSVYNSIPYVNQEAKHVNYPKIWLCDY